MLYSAIRKEALLTSQFEGTQATLADLFAQEAGFAVTNTFDVEEVTNYLRAFRLVQSQLRDPAGLHLSVRLLCDAHRLFMTAADCCTAGALALIARTADGPERLLETTPGGVLPPLVEGAP